MGEGEAKEEIAGAWDAVARAKYEGEFAEHVVLLRRGGHNLLAPELAALDGRIRDARVIHLQCSHGLDALGLLNLGARSVVGLDISREMIDQARRKAQAVGRAADFRVADVVDPPGDLAGTAELVYTGRGALPWLRDIERWGRAVATLLRPGGEVYVFEGHPLNAVWDPSAAELRMAAGAGYFETVPRESPGFPASVLRRVSSDDRPTMLEHQWRPGQVIAALLAAGLTLHAFDEHPDPYWNQFDRWPRGLAGRLPQTYSVQAAKPLDAGR